MKKRIGAALVLLLALAVLTFAVALPAAAADSDIIIGVYYYDASGNLIDLIYGMEFTQPVGYNLTHAQKAFDDIEHMALLTGAARTEVRLLADVPAALSVPAGTTATLNLNGFTLGAAGDSATLTVAAGGVLTVTDTSADKSGSIAYTGTAAVGAIENHGKLTVETANVGTTSAAALITNSGDSARITVTGGNFVTSGNGNFENGDGARIAVSGGIFTEEVLPAFCAAGYEPLTLDAGRYSVKEAAYDDRFGETLTVVGQAAAVQNGTAYYPIDAVCGIDALDYKAVGVEYRVIRTGTAPYDHTDKTETTAVYTSVTLTAVSGTKTVCKPADLGAAYLYTARFLFDASAFTETNTALRLTPYAVGTDGTVYRGRTVELDGDVCADNGVTLFAKGE